MARNTNLPIEDKNNLCAIVRKAEQTYIYGTTTTSKYVQSNQYENIEKIDAYLNSKHISGDTDALGREKPFFNIVTAASNIWYRATDIDRKNIIFRPTRSNQVVPAYLATIHLQDYMRRENFGSFLNEWGMTLARYGSAVSKFVEKQGRLHTQVVPWNRLIVDTIDFENNIKIEILELTEAQLYQRDGYDKEMVEALCETKKARELLNKQNQDTKNDYIRLYEVHGVLPLSMLTGKDKDNDTYVQQMHVISFVAGQNKGSYDDFTLVKGRESKDPYMISHLIKQDGRCQSIGAVEHLFEAQWMQNHTIKAIKDQLDLASKLIFQTADGNYVGQNALTAIENGDILIHDVNKPLTQIQNNSHDITSLQSFASQWKALGNEITGISEAMLGAAPKSGTAWRQTEAMLQESYSLFELMTENKGLAIEEMMRTHIIPFLKKQMNNADEIVATLGDYGIKQIEDIYIRNTVNQIKNDAIKEAALSGKLPQPIDSASIEKNIKDTLNQNGNTRFIKPSDVSDKTWKDVFNQFEWEIQVDVTGEAQDTQSMMTTLNTLFTTLARLNGQPMSPEMKLVYNKIITTAGNISPLELSQADSSQPIAEPTQPQQSMQTIPTPQIPQTTQ